MSSIEWRVLGYVAMFFLARVTDARDVWDHPPKGRPQGIEHHTFQSASMRIPVGFNICLPPEYLREPNRRFPVIYYLHGYGGNESSFLDYATYWRESLARTGPCLLVFVNGGETSFFSDAPDGSVMGETVVAKELVPQVDARFRTVPQAGGRSLHGYSMGGFGALKLALKYPDLFESVVAYGATLSSAAEMRQHLEKVFNRMFGRAERFEASNPFTLLQNSGAQMRGRLAIEVIVGTKDEFLNANRDLAGRLKTVGVEHRYIELPGVKHDKEPLYQGAARQAFEFTAKKFAQETGRPGASVPSK